jgi:hypothetical protein
MYHITARCRAIGFARTVRLRVKEDEDRNRWNGSIGTGMEFPLASFAFDGVSASLEYHSQQVARASGVDGREKVLFRSSSCDEFADTEFPMVNSVCAFLARISCSESDFLVAQESVCPSQKSLHPSASPSVPSHPYYVFARLSLFPFVAACIR